MPNLYGDDSAQESAPPPRPQADQAPDEKKQHQDDAQTGVLPKSLFKGDVKPGMRYTLEVDQVMDDEVACRVLPDDQKEPEGDEPPMPPPEEGEGAPMPSNYQ